MANKCLFKILNQIYLFPHRPQKKGKLKGFHLDGDHVSLQNTLPNSSNSTQVTKETEIWKAFTWMTTKCLFKILGKIYLFPHRSQKKRKLESFLKHSTKDIYESTILVNKSRIKNCFKWNTRKGLKVQVIFWTMVVIFSFMGVVNAMYATFLSHASHAACRGWLRIGCWIGAATLRTSCSQFLFFQHQTLFVPKFHPLPLLSGLRGKPSMCHNWSNSSNKIFTRPTPQSHYNIINTTGGSPNGSRQFIFNLINQ